MSYISITEVETVIYVYQHYANGCVSLSCSVSVVLLDTTSVLGELGWNTYPMNGVRECVFGFVCMCVSG